MSVCGQNGQTEEDSASEEVAATATRDIYKQKPASKVVRVLTVLAYLLSVSLAAILLSVYYICVWKSPELPLEVHDSTVQASARRANYTDYRRAEHAAQISHSPGGGDTTVNDDTLINSPPENITSSSTEDGVVTELSSDSTLSTTTPTNTVLGLNNRTSDYGSFDDTDSIT